MDILKSIPLSKLPWLGFFPLKRPITVPAGNGLLINPDARSAPNSLQALITKVDSVAILRLPLAGLMSLPDRWEVKLKLIECALGELDHLARETISDAAFWWLADASSVGRAMALRLVDSHLVADWLSSPLASADDLLTLKPHLTEVNQEACALLAERSLKPFEIYARVFPSDPKRLWHLMPPQMKRIDESLQSLSAQLSAEATDQYFEFVAGTVIEGKDTEVLANAVRCGSSKALEKFSARLAESGLSTALVNALLHGYSIDLSEDPPRLLPSQDWILGIDEENWLNLGRELMGNRSWRNWWLNGWRLSFRRGRLDSDRLVAEAIHSRQPDLLKRAGASDTVCNLIDVNAPSVRLMEAATSWDPRYNRLIDEMYADLSLFDRIGDPLTEQFFKWLESCLSSGHAERFRSLYGQLISGECVESRYILALVKLLTRSQRLRQIAVWYQASAGDQRKTVLTELLESASDQLHRDEVDFIQTVVFHCRPLPPLPEWTAGDLNNMLPLIGVEAVIRQVMIRKQVDSTGERLLLASILRKLAAQPRCTPIPPPSPSEQTRRPDWFDALKEYLPDW